MSLSHSGLVGYQNSFETEPANLLQGLVDSRNKLELRRMKRGVQNPYVLMIDYLVDDPIPV